MKNKINLDDIDDSLIQDLIDHCEEKMSSGYKDKADKKKLDIEAIVKPEEGSDEEEATESLDEESKEDEIDPEQMQKLLDMYRSIKGK